MEEEEEEWGEWVILYISGLRLHFDSSQLDYLTIYCVIRFGIWLPALGMTRTVHQQPCKGGEVIKNMP